MRRNSSPSEMVIRQRLGALTRALPGAQKGDVALLHQARVATRRLREAVPLVAHGARARRLERAARRLTRALGPVRELDVALQTLDRLGATGGASPAAIRALKQVIRQERQRLHAEMCRRIERVDLDKLRHRAVAMARKSRVRGRDPKRLAAARLRTATRAVRLREAIENAAAIYLPDRLHEVRIAVKKLRYATEVMSELSLAAAQRRRATARLRSLKDAQELLGGMNDLEALIVQIRALQGSAAAPTLRVSADLDRLVRRLETDCREMHGRYMAMRKTLIAICDRTAPDAAPRRGTHLSSAA